MAVALAGCSYTTVNVKDKTCDDATATVTVVGTIVLHPINRLRCRAHREAKEACKDQELARMAGGTVTVRGVSETIKAAADVAKNLKAIIDIFPSNEYTVAYSCRAINEDAKPQEPCPAE